MNGTLGSCDVQKSPIYRVLPASPEIDLRVDAGLRSALNYLNSKAVMYA